MEDRQFTKRNAVFDCLRASHAHPSAEMLYAELQDTGISLATVYRNLALFKRQGRIVTVATVDGAERFDWNTAPHVHFVCTGCGAVLDLPELLPPQSLWTEAASTVGGSVSGCQVTLTGLCGKCHSCDTGCTAPNI